MVLACISYESINGKEVYCNTAQGKEGAPMRMLTQLKRRLSSLKQSLLGAGNGRHLGGSTGGFTLIEMLIVITVLGILAVLIIVAINPVEQINRSRDTTSRSDAGQLASALERFYAFNGFYPWQTSATDVDDAGMAWSQFTSALVDDDGCPVTEKLSVTADEDCVGSGTDELKESFLERVQAANYNPLRIFRAAGGSVYVCFEPKSAAFIQEAATRADGTLPDDFPDDETQAVGNTTHCGADGNCSCLP